jgi:hypothetical protein
MRLSKLVVAPFFVSAQAHYGAVSNYCRGGKKTPAFAALADWPNLDFGDRLEIKRGP